MSVRVYHSGPNNSTAFTRCCSVAICDHQRQCPNCKAFVYPDEESDDKERIERSDHARGLARFNQAFAPFRAAARKHY